ncbi:MAG: maltotransferase domain-containing protein [Propionibacteriaceae bacterium]
MKSAMGIPIGRIPVTTIAPVIEGGAYPAKATVDERITLSACVFRDGHDAVGAMVDLVSPQGDHRRIELHRSEPCGLDIWSVQIALDHCGLWQFSVIGYHPEWETWRHHAAVKLAAVMDLELVCLEGRDLIHRACAGVPTSDTETIQVLDKAAELLDPTRSPTALRETALDDKLHEVMQRYAPRTMQSPSPYYPILCESERARFSAWYEFFPRSWGAYQNPDGTWTSGTFATAKAGLDHAAALGFDVVYLPPIHPIGTAFKKGPNNTLDAGPTDVGSPWAIGNSCGGHEAIHPELGTLADFSDFVEYAQERGLAIAMDLVLNCSPDHPWVSQHPEWFFQRLDGTTAYAENPPKKYQDVYPLNFDTDPEGLGEAIYELVLLWISRGITIFRVDNPHTKPVAFWAWLIAKVRHQHPEVIWLAEAFTRPAMTKILGEVGFTQSYTYFTWRNSKAELEQYLTELSTEWSSFFRPNFFTNTPDINPVFTQSGKPAAFAIRALLAATMSPSWGMYCGFEIYEHALIGHEEYLDSEKYQLRPRDFTGDSIMVWIRELNRLRREHPALQQLGTIAFHETSSDEIIAYSKVLGDDRLLIVCSLNPDTAVSAWVSLNREALGISCGAVELTDVLSGERAQWDQSGWVGLDPSRVGHIFQVRSQA